MKKPTSARRTAGKKNDSWQALMAEARRFRDARDWSQFHTPKNLAAAIAIEAAELQEEIRDGSDFRGTASSTRLGALALRLHLVGPIMATSF